MGSSGNAEYMGSTNGSQIKVRTNKNKHRTDTM